MAKYDKVQLGESEVYTHFKDIFQSQKTRNHPTADDVEHQLSTYEMQIPILDANIKNEELQMAIIDIGKGIGIDGLPGNISRW